MKRIFRNLMFGLALCAGAGITSCSSDLDDPMDTIPYSRVLTPMNFEAEVVASKGTDITFKWSAVQNASSYVLELFEAVESIETDDSGTETTVYVAPDYDAEGVSPYLSIDVPANGVPYTVEDLEVDMTFYARVRGVSQSVPASHWAYLTEAVSTSAVRDMLNPFIVERTMSAVKIGWDDAEDKLDLTSIRVQAVVPAEGETARTIALSDEEKNACEAEVSGLDACRNYKFTLLFGKSGSRGVVTAWTRPNTEGAQEIKTSEEFVAAIQGASADLKLSLAYSEGVVYDLTSVMTTKDGVIDPYEFAYGLTIYGQSSEDGQKPVVKASFKNTGAGAYHFEDIAVDGALQGYFFTSGAAVSDAEFINCEFYGFSKGLWSGSDACDVANLVYDGIYAHDINANGTGGGDFIDVRIKTGSYGTIDIKNSTFYACARTFLRVREGAGAENIKVANCTFNQVTATLTSSNNSGIFEIRNYTPASFTLSKCLFLNELSDGEGDKPFVRLCRNSADNFAPICDGNIFYNVGPAWFDIAKCIQTSGATFSEELALADGGMMLEEDPCTNSIAGKMYLKNGVIAANRVGDPRWWDATQPVVVRPTELTTVTEPTVWDFTDKIHFQSETVETNQIIENIRIYAPAELVMEEGLTFASASKLDKNGRPTSSALQFRVQGVGAVEVTTADAGFNASVEVVAAGDRYTLLADGKTHKVVLGDLVGENDIYVLTGSAVTFTKVAWTDDLTPEATVTPLAAPAVKVDNTSFDEGTEVAVTASWAAVENAASYEVTFQGKKTETTETSFTIDAATVAALGVATYEISVVAKPVATSSKYSASEAGVATFKVNKVILAGFSTVTWNFLTFDGTNLADGATWTNNTAFAQDVVWTINPDFPMTIMNGVTVQAAGSTNGAKTADGSSFLTSAPTRRALYFTATAPGKLKYTVKSGNSSDPRSTYVAVSTASEYKVVYTSDPAIEEKTYEVDLMNLVGGETIYIFGKGNNFSVIEWTYVDENAGKSHELVWDCDDASFDAIGAAMGTDGSLTATIPGLVWDGLTILTGSKTKYGTSDFGRYIQWGGKGAANKDRSCYFTAPASGKLTVLASNTGNSEDLTRMVGVTVNGVETTVAAGTPANVEPTVCTFDIDVEGETPVYIYAVNNGLRFFSIKFEYVE